MSTFLVVLNLGLLLFLTALMGGCIAAPTILVLRELPLGTEGKILKAFLLVGVIIALIIAAVNIQQVASFMGQHLAVQLDNM